MNGDVTQIDLPQGKASGLIDAESRLKRVKGIAFVRFTKKDVVRHDLVSRIIRAYEQTDDRAAPPEKNGKNSEKD